MTEPMPTADTARELADAARVIANKLYDIGFNGPRHGGIPVITGNLMCEAAQALRSLADQNEALVRENSELTLALAEADSKSDAQLQEWNAAEAALAAEREKVGRMQEALLNIRIEAERENGRWQHLKRVIGMNARAALDEETR